MSVLHEQIPTTTPRGFTMAIIEEVARAHGVRVADILGPCRERPLVKARHEAIRRVHQARPNMSTPEIGRMFNRDHKTILSALGGRRVHAGTRQNQGESFGQAQEA